MRKWSLCLWCRLCEWGLGRRNRLAMYLPSQLLHSLLQDVTGDAHLIAYPLHPPNHLRYGQLVPPGAHLPDSLDDGEVALQRVKRLDSAIVVARVVD